MFWDVLIAIGIGLTQLAVTAYAVDISVKENRIKNAVVIGTVGLIGIGLTVAGTIRNSKSQETATAKQQELQNKIDAVQKKLDDSQRASVGLYFLQFWPNQQLIADKDISAQIMNKVTDGMAANLRAFHNIFTLRGSHNDELDKRAIEKFRKEAVGKLDYRGEDHVQGTGEQGTLRLRLTKKELLEVLAANRIVYVVARLEWNNATGGDFHLDLCKWMDQERTERLETRGWHECHP